jgi:hypothetical protein
MDSAARRPAGPRWTWLWLLPFGLAVLAGSLWATYPWQRRRPVPPPVLPAAESSPFLNTRPGVRYVGSARCAECHDKEAATYANHPMGRSVSPAGRPLGPRHAAAPSFQAGGLTYSVEHDSDHLIHKAVALLPGGGMAAEERAEAAFVIGSGQQGQSFLIDRDGYLFQSPISWYSRDGAWRLSPGYVKNNQHFTRPIIESCLFCHVNEARIEPDTINHYRPRPLRLEPIGCERCHGPGELHVAAREMDDVPAGKDHTIVNPRHLEPQLREAVCQQCHLQGETRVTRRGRSLYDYRPGLPAHEFWSAFVRPAGQGDTRRAVSHVEQMYLSRCFQASTGKMGCTSCHDPHARPSAAERVAWYRGRCLNCHQDTSCSLSPHERHRRDPADSCIGCHMPAGDSSNIAHASLTDHRIVRRPEPAAEDDPAGDFSLVPFYSEQVGEQRDLGLALAELTSRPFPEAQRRRLAHRACEALGPVVERTPDDVAALEGLGLALWKDGRPREALNELEKALREAPRHELVLEKAALVTQQLRDTERSIIFWKRLLAIDPYRWVARAYLAQALADRNELTSAVAECRSALRLDPFEVRTRMLLIDCLGHLGEKDQARTEFERLLALKPPQPDRLRQWFDELMRGQ